MQPCDISRLIKNPTEEAIRHASIEVDRDLRVLNRQLEDLQNQIGKHIDYQTVITDLKLNLNK